MSTWAIYLHFDKYPKVKIASEQPIPQRSKKRNHQNVLFLASIPCDISQQLWFWSEKSQGNRVKCNALIIRVMKNVIMIKERKKGIFCCDSIAFTM